MNFIIGAWKDREFGMMGEPWDLIKKMSQNDETSKTKIWSKCFQAI